MFEKKDNFLNRFPKKNALLCALFETSCVFVGLGEISNAACWAIDHIRQIINKS